MESGPADESYTVGWICALQTKLDAAMKNARQKLQEAIWRWQ